MSGGFSYDHDAYGCILITEIDVCALPLIPEEIVMKRSIACLIACTLIICLASCSWSFSIPPAASGSHSSDTAVLEPEAAAVYPDAIAYEDYDARSAVRTANPLDDNFLAALQDFSYNTASSVLLARDGNANYSPVSLYFALALAGSGADGTTRQEFLDLLGMEDTDGLSAQCANLFRRLYTDSGISILRIADSVWMDSDIEGRKISFKESFLDNAVNRYFASLYSVDFSDDAAGKAMSRWIADNTNGTLAPSMELSDIQIMTLLNTIYFYDEWVNEFDENLTAAEVFHVSDSKDVTFDFMNMTLSSQQFFDGDGYIRSSLYMKSGNSMVFILPDEDVSVDSLLASPEKVRAIFEGGNASVGEVVFQIPKFGFDSSYDLTDILKGFGIRSAFDSSADFSGITDGPAYISEIRQETHIAVNEKGVEASAFTQIDFYGSAMPVGRAEMILDRPFIYGITGTDGTLLFVGVCGNPAV